MIKRDKHYNWSHGFPFLGIAKCGECGAAITAEQHQKFYQTTNRKVNYIYYRCTKKLGPCRQKYILQNDLESQIRKAVSDVSLPDSWGNKWFALLEKDEILENQKKKENIQRLVLEIERIEQKLNILLDSFLDGVIESEIYKQKKNELLELKIKLNENLEEVKVNGSSWLEPMRKFTKDAMGLGKIAAAKNNFSDLAIGAKTVGSNFFLTNRRLFVRYKGGFITLWLNGGSQSVRSSTASDSLLVALS